MILVRDGTGKSGKLWVIKSGRKKMLRGIINVMEIKDMATMSEELTPEVAERQESAERAVLHVLSEFRKDRDQISSD